MTAAETGRSSRYIVPSQIGPGDIVEEEVVADDPVAAVQWDARCWRDAP